MTTTNQALRPFAELQTEALTSHAMVVFADPKSPLEHRNAAKAHLLKPTSEGIDWSKVPLERRRQILLALDDLKRLEADGDCFAVELDNAGEFARAYQACDGRISPGEFGLLAALRLTPHERRKRWDDLKLVEAYGLLRVGGVELAKPSSAGKESISAPGRELNTSGDLSQPLVTEPFNMPFVEPVEPSAADFIELDCPPNRPPVDPRRRLSDAELAEHDPDRAEAVHDAKSAQAWEAFRRR